MYTKHQWESSNHYNFKYVQYLPKDYDPTKTYPLVFFLHGAGERGDDLDLASRHGYAKHMREDGADYPFIYIAPQCPFEKYWGCFTESLVAFLDYICEELPIDRDRIYLTGLSMGGTGTWMLAMAQPERFAAIAPRNPAARIPANVAQFNPNGPGVISAIATISETSVALIQPLEIISLLIKGTMDKPPKLVNPIFKKLQNNRR